VGGGTYKNEFAVMGNGDAYAWADDFRGSGE